MDSVCQDVVITAARGIYAGAKALSVMHSESSSLTGTSSCSVTPKVK